MPAAIDYYFAPISPYSYLGHERFAAIAANHGAAVNLIPIDLMQVFPVSGGIPVGKRAPQRQAYRLVELQRWSDHLGVPLTLHPKHWPTADAAASRLVIAADAAGADAMGLAFALMRACWSEDRDIADPATLEAIAGDCGLDPVLLEAAEAPEVEDKRLAFTQQAIDRQVFGAPFYVMNGESFWGQDRLDFVDRALAAA